MGHSKRDLIFVRFVLDSDEKYGSAFKKDTCVWQIRDDVANVLDVDKQSVRFYKQNKRLNDSVTLHELTNNAYVTLLQDSSKGETKIIEKKVRENIPTLEVITVHLTPSPTSDLVVSIENQSCIKEWLGGYRNKKTGVEYHNAEAQTKLWRKKIYQYSKSEYATPLFCHRETQTNPPTKDKEVATTVSKTTQMWRQDLNVSSKTDRIITSKHYTRYSALSIHDIQIRKAIVIQNAVRDWLAGRKILNVIKSYKSMLNTEIRLKDSILTDQAEKERLILINTSYPTSRNNFYVLYLMLEKWLKKELEKIAFQQTTVSQKASRSLLLQKETNLLFAIEKQRILAKQESLKKEDMRFLNMVARPHRFKNTKGQVRYVDDLDTQRAREFNMTYCQLVKPNVDPKDRIDFLLSFKKLFVEHYKEYEFYDDLISLIDREINLLTIGTKDKFLHMLRKRIEQLFMYFLKQKQFNPKCAKYKKPNWPKTIDKLFRCTRCNKMLPASKYPVHIRMTAYELCTSCAWLRNIGDNRKDMGPYLKLLRQVQEREMEKCCHSSVCFVMQQIGMSYLTNVLWHGRSIVSECQDLTKLTHVRWIADMEWAPWNTVLLTDQEAKVHTTLHDPETFYSQDFINVVHYRHMLARSHFVHLLKMDHYLRSTGAWQNVRENTLMS